jgi:hypothetical protein
MRMSSPTCFLGTKKKKKKKKKYYLHIAYQQRFRQGYYGSENGSGGGFHFQCSTTNENVRAKLVHQKRKWRFRSVIFFYTKSFISLSCTINNLFM